ncbi:hypothetical protein [Brachybacterium phenoliresistens]|uniref:hypothetical protein n=1 Tax=Brachybacterium phenoliresistens TaxID=396014 RepID=UPI0031DE4F96
MEPHVLHATHDRVRAAYGAAIDANYLRGRAAYERLARLATYAELLSTIAYAHVDSAEAKLLADHITQIAAKIREIADAHLAHL